MSSYPDLLDVIPTLTSWRKTSSGHIKGNVCSHPHRKDGTRIRVNPASTISNENLLEGNLLITLGNHYNYCLGRTEKAKRKEYVAAELKKYVAQLKAEREEYTAKRKAENEEYTAKQKAEREKYVALSGKPSVKKNT